MRGPTTTGWRRARPEFPISSGGAGAADFSATFRLILLTNDPALAAAADSCVERIGIDFEHIGKAARQAGYDTRVSRHAWSDLEAIACKLRQAKPFARLNARHDGTEAEVETALSCGVQMLMLPFFRGGEEVERFVALVRGRAEVMCLVETASSFVRMREILEGIAHQAEADPASLGLQGHQKMRLLQSRDLLRQGGPCGVAPVVGMA